MKYLVIPGIVGVAAAIAAALNQGRTQLLLAGVWGLCILYCLAGIPLLLMWITASSRLASVKLSDELGYRIRIRGTGGSLDVEAWREKIDRAMERHRREQAQQH
ncbi:MAG: hypothetical protein WBA31_05445 [Candidatus Dormiibacterota bacterium]